MPDAEHHMRLMNMGMDYIKSYKKGDFQLEHLNSLPSVRHSIIMIYHMLIGQKKIQAIETLAHADKVNLWELAKPFTGGLNVEDAKDVVRCYLVLDYLAQISEQ